MRDSKQMVTQQQQQGFCSRHSIQLSFPWDVFCYIEKKVDVCLGKKILS